MRSQVQVLAGPPPIPAGHGPLARRPSTPGGRHHDHHPPCRPPGPGRQPPAAATTSRCSRLPLRAHRAAASDPTDQRATRAASPAFGLLGRRPSRWTRWQPAGTRPLLWCRLPGAATWFPTPPPAVGRDGRVRTDGGTAAGWTLRRAAAVWRATNQDRAAARTTRTGPVTAATVSCRCHAVQLAPRRAGLLGLIGVERRARGSRSSVMAMPCGVARGAVCSGLGRDGSYGGC
jgi:hypothetical protein